MFAAWKSILEGGELVGSCSEANWFRVCPRSKWCLSAAGGSENAVVSRELVYLLSGEPTYEKYGYVKKF